MEGQLAAGFLRQTTLGCYLLACGLADALNPMGYCYLCFGWPAAGQALLPLWNE